MATPIHAIRLRKVTKSLGGVTALDRVDFEVEPGDVRCLAGENGNGKSTLIKIITRDYVPEPGAELSFFGRPEAMVTPTQARLHGSAVIWQDLALFAEMTVAENIGFETLPGNRPRRVNYAAMRRAATAALAQLGVALDLDARLGTLPIGQRQIVAIAPALVGDARLILMDEPTASLTQSETDALLAVVRTLSARGVAVVFVSHRLAEVLAFSARVTVLRDGKRVGVYPAAGMTQSKLTELMTGKTYERDVAARETAGNPPVLQVAALSRRGEYAGISLTLRAGEVLGLTGLIGAGRTELGHTPFGMTLPDAGTIRLMGRPLHLRSNRDAVAAGIAHVSEDRLALVLALLCIGLSLASDSFFLPAT